MAHTGKDYELLFRRDLCIGCTNYRRSIPLRLKMTVGLQQVSPPFDAWQALNELAELTTDQFTSYPQWETSDITDNGKTFRLRLTLEDPDVGNQRCKALFEWVDSGIVRIHAVVRNPTAGNCSGFGNPGLPYPAWIIDDLAYWGGINVNGPGNATAWRWTDS